MAEMALKIGQGSGIVPYEDGDVIEVYSDRRIGCCYMQLLHDPRKVKLTPYGLREIGSLGEFALHITKEFRFDRVANEVVRTTLSTMDQETLGPTPNAAGEYIHVVEWLERALDNPKHKVFGEPGSEYWYGGKSDYAAAKIDAVWAEIEKRTPQRRADYPLWPAGRLDLKHHFLISMDDFSEAEEREFSEPLTQVNTVVKRRKRNVDWRANLGLSLGTQGSVVDRDVTVDKRDQFSYLKANIAEVKAVVVS
jgi:hypothetical protein